MPCSIFEEVGFLHSAVTDGFELTAIANNPVRVSGSPLNTVSGFTFAMTMPGSVRSPGPTFSRQDMQAFCDALARAGFSPSTEGKPGDSSSALAAQSAHIADLRELLHHAMKLKKPVPKAPRRQRSLDEPMSANAGDF